MPDRLADYYHSMDRDYHAKPLMPIREIGMSKMITKDALQPLITAIRSGASKVELGFLGQGKGSIFAGQLTPESVGSHERRAIRELAKVNKIELSTHASVGIAGLSGMDRQGNLSDEGRENTIKEIRRAIDFAADTAQGGAVVFHTSEFQTDIGDKRYGKDKKHGTLFANYPGQLETETTVSLVDKKTGKNLGRLSRNDPFPIAQKNEKTGEWKTEKWDWSKFEEYAEQLSKERNEKISAEEAFIDKWQIQQIEQEEEKLTDVEANVEILRQRWEDSKKMGSEQEEYHKKRYDHSQRSVAQLKEKIKDSELRRKNKEIVPFEIAALEKSADSIAQTGIYAYDKTVDTHAKKPIFVAPENLFPGSYGAHPKELKNIIIKSRNQMTKLLTQQYLEKEQYSTKEGGMVKVKIDNPMWRPEINEKKAKKLSEEHIKATFDIGHVNIWRKYFKARPGERKADTDKRFNKWVIKEVDDLKKSNIIGHVHISDNMGFEDEHLTPGTGTVPIVEFIKKMREGGTQLDLVVEPGAQDPMKQYQALYGGWRLFGHSIYGPDSSFRGVSSEEQHAGPTYWGARTSPNLMYGENLPSNEYRGSPFWSGLGLE